MSILNDLVQWGELAPQELEFLERTVVLRDIGYSFHTDFLPKELELWLVLKGYIEFCIGNRGWHSTQTLITCEDIKSIDISISDDFDLVLSVSSSTEATNTSFMESYTSLMLKVYVKMLKHSLSSSQEDEE